MLPDANRLKTDYDFRKVKKFGTAKRTPYFTLIYYKNNKRVGLESRFGFIASKKFDKLAVKRNRAKRLMREAVLKSLPKIKNGYDIILIAHHGIKNVSFKEVNTTFNKILSELPFT